MITLLRKRERERCLKSNKFFSILLYCILIADKSWKVLNKYFCFYFMITLLGKRDRCLKSNKFFSILLYCLLIADKSWKVVNYREKISFFKGLTSWTFSP